jgi:hypothetical protein
MSVKFEEMTTEEIKNYVSVLMCQNYSQIRDYIFLHFLNSKEVVKKAILAKRIFERYNDTFKAETIASVIKDYINMGILFDVGNGNVKISTPEDWTQRDEKIINQREKEQHEN